MGIDWLFWVLFGLLGKLSAWFREFWAELAGYRVISLDMSYYFLKAVFTWTLSPTSCCQFHIYCTHLKPAVWWPALVQRTHKIHQDILICPVGHPLLHRTIAKVIETPPSFVSGRSPGHMTFCAQMWDLLEEQAIAKLKFGPNQLRDWGTAWLLRENQTRGRLLKGPCKAR